MENFKKKNLFELRRLNLELLKEYYLELRKYEYKNNEGIKGIKIRQKIHNLLLLIVKIDRMIEKEKVIVLTDKRKKTDKPKIYACTHIGGNDIQRTFEAIKEHAYLFLGDPDELYRNAVGKLLSLNGTICLETRNSEDRKISKQRAIELLNKGGNLLIYPEGAWNVTDNLPVMKLYPGVVKMAKETGAEIIPVAIEQNENEFFVSIGENINLDNTTDNIKILNDNLRDTLASLKWNIWQQFPIQKRNEITKEYVKNYKQSIVDKCEYGYTLQDVYETMYKDSNEITDDEIFDEIRKKILKK